MYIENRLQKIQKKKTIDIIKIKKRLTHKQWFGRISRVLCI